MPKKLTLDEIKDKLKIINPNIDILETEYINSKEKMNCHCLTCDNNWKMNWNNLSNDHGCPFCYQNSKSLTNNEMIKFITENGYTFIEFIKTGTSIESRIKIKCPENHIYETGYRPFYDGSRCRKCAARKYGESLLKDVSEVKKLISDNNYSIVGDFNYENTKTKFNLKCINGHLRQTNYQNLFKTPICPLCSPIRKVKFDIEEVRKILNDLGMELLDDNYINARTPIKYKCTCGNITYSRFGELKRGHKCLSCSGNKIYTIQELKGIFNEFGCELLSAEFKGTDKKLKFKCNCGRIGNKLLYDFKRSPRCIQCGLDNRSGENHPCWNSELTNDERMKNRKYKEYKHWRLAVYERDHYTCQCCGDNSGGNLNAHHLDSHDWAKDKRLDLDNGVTLCEDCHTDFHKVYGYGKNTKQQFEEYLNIKLSNNAI